MKQKKQLRAKTQLKAKSGLKASKIAHKQPKPSVAKLKKKADVVFSQYVRLRDRNICITCGGEGNQAGHFQSRKYNSTRFDDMNVNAQCFRCNVLFYGEQYKYALAIDLKYGDGMAKELATRAAQPHPFTVDELQEIIDYSKEQIEVYTKNLNKESMAIQLEDE